MAASNRRDFLQFLGGVGTLALLGPGCQKWASKTKPTPINNVSPLGMLPSFEDQINLAPGFEYKLLITEGTDLGNDLFFGANNDFTQFVTRKNGPDAFLWVNHEYFSPYLVSGRHRSDSPTRAQYLKERETVGGSIIKIHQNPTSGQWEFKGADADNKRLSGSSKIPFTHPIDGKDFGIGSFANCSGGLTPWNTILTCEENFENFYGEWIPTADGKGKIIQDRRSLNWSQVESMDPRHYGWVVEFNPETGESKKLLGLGRFAHECAKVVTSKDGKLVVYTGDDRDDECLYKFIATKSDSLDEGELFVASMEQQKWISMDITKQPILQKNFKDQTDVLIRARQAAKLLGGTPLARPEDIEQDPITGDIFIALTNNKPKNDFHGSILKISEKDKLHSSLEFISETYIAGGPDSGFSCPDNLCFDQKGNLWLTCDISGKAIGKTPYKDFGNNGLYVIPRSGEHAGKVIQVASAPNDAELTGPCFSPDYKTLFVSVQHPGELSKKGQAFTSNWPHGGNEKPLSSVITLTGPALEGFTLG